VSGSKIPLPEGSGNRERHPIGKADTLNYIGENPQMRDEEG